MRQYGLTPSQATALLAAPNGRADLSFTRSREVRLHARLLKEGVDEGSLEGAVKMREEGDTTHITVHLPTAGEYGLEVGYTLLYVICYVICYDIGYVLCYIICYTID